MRTALLKREDVEKLTGFKRTKIFELMKDEGFPAPIKYSQTAYRWVSTEVDAWLADFIKRTPRLVIVPDKVKRATRHNPQKAPEVAFAELLE